MAQTSLAERLGYGADDRLLIVNCDDLGSSHGANAAIHRALVYGAISTSASLMVPCPWAREAACLLKPFPIGVHLTLTSEYAGYRWRGLTEGASLHDSEGFLWPTNPAALAQLRAADAHAECHAQIATALAWGIDVTHLDTHMNVLQDRSDLFDIYLDLAAEFRLPVRMLSPEHTDRQGFDARARARAKGIICNDHMIDQWPKFTRDMLAQEIPGLPPGVTATYAHPVEEGTELRAYDRHSADLRADDAECLMDTGVATLLERHNVTRISFRELRELQRAS